MASSGLSPQFIPASAERGTVLLVNDSQDYIDLLSAILSSDAYQVLAADGGQAALWLLGRARPDLIISDVVMPGINGVELCRRIKSNPEIADTPVLLVTALRYDDAGVLEGLEAGADDYLEAHAPIELLRKKVERLIAGFRESRERARLQQQLIQAEKMAALGQLVSGAAHELNNPLSSLVGYSDVLLGLPSLDAEARGWLETIRKEADRARRIVQSLLSFARQDKPRRAPVDVNDLLEQTLGLRAYEMKVSGIIVERELSPLPRVLADAHQLQQVFLNIIINAEQAMQEAGRGGTLRVKTEIIEAEQRQCVAVRIGNNGPPIEKEIVSRIFDPFFTTKEVGRGTGLGLSISYGIVQEHGGRIWAESEAGGGVTFNIELPLA
jgi:signal transduction histidine kinase